MIEIIKEINKIKYISLLIITSFCGLLELPFENLLLT